MTGGGSSIPEVQALLRVLACGRRCGEVGTAFGEGAAAMAETAARVVTVEVVAERAAIARERLRGRDNVELLVGDWRELLPAHAPFELLFFDGGRFAEAADAIDLVAPGGLLVKDDLTPARPGSGPRAPVRASAAGRGRAPHHARDGGDRGRTHRVIIRRASTAGVEAIGGIGETTTEPSDVPPRPPTSRRRPSPPRTTRAEQS